MPKRYGCVKCRSVRRNAGQCKACNGPTTEMSMEHTVFEVGKYVLAAIGLGMILFAFTGDNGIFALYSLAPIAAAVVLNIFGDRKTDSDAKKRLQQL